MNLFDHEHLGTITQLTTTKDGWVSVYADGKRVARVPRRDAERLGLLEGQAWTTPLATACTVATDAWRARRTAVALIRVRPRSRAELLERLAGAGFTRQAAEAAVGALVAERLVDDAALAELMASRAATKGMSGRATADRLRARGLAGAAPATAGSELEKAIDAARNRAAGLPESLDAPARARRVLGALARLGYEEELAREAVQRVLGFQDE